MSKTNRLKVDGRSRSGSGTKLPERNSPTSGSRKKSPLLSATGVGLLQNAFKGVLSNIMDDKGELLPQTPSRKITPNLRARKKDIEGRLQDIEEALQIAAAERLTATAERAEASKQRSLAAVKRAELEAKMKERRDEEASFRRKVADLQVLFLTKAFSIMMAYQIATIFYIIVYVGAFQEGLNFNVHHPSTIANLTTRLIWWALNYITTPLLLIYTKGAVAKGSAQRTFRQDCRALLAQSVGMLNAWAFKDVVVAVIKLWVNPPKSSWDDGELFYYFCFLCSIAIGVFGFVIFLQYALRTYLNFGPTRGGFARKWVTAVPSALGLGFALHHPLTVAWFNVLGEAHSTYYATTIRTALWKILVCGIASKGIVKVVKWDLNRADANRDPMEQEFCSVIVHILTKALSFVFAWTWADLFNVLFFNICFGVSNSQAGMFPNLYYASCYTFIALQVVPAVKTRAESLRRLGEVFTDTIMVNDKEAINSTAAHDELLINMLGVSVGWAWTNVAAAQCSTPVEPFGCPSKSLEVVPFFKFLFFASVFIFLTTFGYHSYLEGVRLQERATKVKATEDGDGDIFFKEADADKNGKISRDELENYVVSNGLGPDTFLKAFDLLDEADGVKDGEVELKPLMAEFSKVMQALEKAKDHPPAVDGEEGAPEVSPGKLVWCSNAVQRSQHYQNQLFATNHMYDSDSDSATENDMTCAEKNGTSEDDPVELVIAI